MLLSDTGAVVGYVLGAVGYTVAEKIQSSIDYYFAPELYTNLLENTGHPII